MPFQPIQPEKLSTAVTRQIEQLILRGILRPGERLPSERELSERLGVSRPSLREAIAELQAKGLLSSRAGAGIFVADVLGSAFSPALVQLFASHSEAVFDYLSFRRDMEGLAAERAARLGSDTDLKVIQTVYDKMVAAHAKRDPSDEAALDGAQFAAGWLPWWGAQDPAKLFQGTFYWHNQVGIFLAVIGILALAVAGSGGPLALLGWVVAPLCVAGTFFSTSRGSQLSLLLGFALVLALIGGRAVLPRVKVLLTGALGVAVSVVLTGPPFFAERVSPAAGTAARSESFVGNGVTRLEDWAAAWQVFERWPLTGAGFDGFRAATEAVGVGHRAGRTAYVHNGFLQGLTDGGLLLGLPLLLVTLVLAVAVCRGLPTVVRHERSGLLVDTHDDTDWARALGRVLTEPGLHDRLAAGAAAQAREFSWDATAGAMLETYERARQLMRAEVTA